MSSELVFGLDLGINNVGWTAVQISEEGVEFQGQGTFVFESPLKDENDPGEGLSSKQRGMFRRARRTTRRRHQRKMSLYRLLAEYALIPKEMSSRVNLFCLSTDPLTHAEANPYALRAAALKRPLEPFELGRVLCHLNQKRAFISPRDLMSGGKFRIDDSADDPNDEEVKGMKLEIQRTADAMAGFETIGAFLNDKLRKGEPVRKKKLKNSTPPQQKAEDERRFVRADRHMIEHEFWTIMRHQSPHHALLTQDFQNQVHKTIFSQRLLAADMSTRGKCTLYKSEWRMPRASLTAQRFRIAQDIAHLELTPEPHANSRKLIEQERQALAQALMTGDDLNWADAKELLGLTPIALFNIEPAKYEIIVNGKKKWIKQTKGTKTELRGSQTVSRLRSIIGEKWIELGEQAQRELVGEIVSIRDWTRDKSDREPAAVRRRNLFKEKAYGPKAVRFSEKEANELATASLPEGYLSISLKAAKKLIPLMLMDMVYSEAVTAIGKDHANPDGPVQVRDRLMAPTAKDISHPVVLASVRSAVRVLNALHREFGKPDAIHIELPRDLAAGEKRQGEIEKRQRENEQVRKEIAKDLVALKYKPNSLNIKKVRLWDELGGAGLAYEPDVIIPDLKALMSGDYEIDHIIPRSHNLDSSMANLTLCTRAFNTQVKGNKTLWQACGNSNQWPHIEAHVKSIKNMALHKRQRILAKALPEQDFTGRHLAATGYISKEVLKLAQQMVEKKENVIVAPGRATAEFRKFWEIDDLVPLHPVEQAQADAWKEFIEKAERKEATEDDVKTAKAPGKARSNFKHHTLDAIVVALASRKSLKAMTDYYQLKDSFDPRVADKQSRKLERAKAMPDPDLRDKVSKALEEAVIVHRARRKPTGELHQQMAKNDSAVLARLPQGEPWSTNVVGKNMVRYDQDGKPVQAYPLGNNHHVVIWERTQENAKGEFERCAEVVPTIEAVRRRDAKEPVVRKHHPEPGWKFVLALCKGDMVEMADGTLAVVSKFYSPSEGKAGITLWHPYVAGQLGKLNAQNPYLVKNLSVLTEIASRVVLNPLRSIVYREGGQE